MVGRARAAPSPVSFTLHYHWPISDIQIYRGKGNSLLEKHEGVDYQRTLLQLFYICRSQTELETRGFLAPPVHVHFSFHTTISHSSSTCSSAVCTDRFLPRDVIRRLFSDELERRAEQCHRQLLSACELGDSASSAEILLYEHAKMEAQAKVSGHVAGSCIVDRCCTMPSR